MFELKRLCQKACSIYIKEGQNARISSELIGDSAIVMPVSRISPFLEAGSFSTTAEIDMPESRWSA